MKEKKTNKYQCVVDAINLMRPQSVILMLLFVIIPIFMEVGDGIYAMCQVVPMFFLLTGEIVLNDYMDVEKDKINKSHRPLAAGRVRMQFAKCLIYVLLGLAVMCGIVIYGLHFERCIIFATISILLTLYSLFVKQIALVKCFITALVTVLCLCFIFTYIGFEKQIFYFIVVAFFYISSREILMDIRDYEGDKKYGCNTIPIRFGKENAYNLAVILMTISQIVYLFFVAWESDIVVLMLWIMSIVVLVYSFLMFRIDNSKLQNKIAIVMWIPMLLSISAIII